MKGQRLGLTFPQRIDSAQLISQGSQGAGVVVPAAIHFWPMNEGSGTSFVDNIGTTNLTAANVTWAVSSGLGAAAVARFNGSSSQAQAASLDASLNFNGTQPMTIAVWVNYAVAANGAIAGDLVAPTTYAGWELGTAAADTSSFLVVGTVTSNQMTAIPTSPNLTVGTGAFLVLTYSGSLTLAGVKLYQNGVAVTPLTDSSGTLTSGAASTVPFLVGTRADGTARFNGSLAFMRVWNSVLTPAQIGKLFSLGPQ